MREAMNENVTPEREEARAARKLRRSRRRWRRFLAVYTFLFLLAGAAGCALLYQYCEAYEASIPEHVMDELMANTTAEDWYGYVRSGTRFETSRFEDAAVLFDEYFDAAVRGREINYRKDMAEYTAQTPVYTVRAGGTKLCTVRLAPLGDKAAGFGRELWQVREILPAFSMDGLESVTVEIDAPAGAEFFINGVAVGEEYLIGETDAPDLTELESRFAQKQTFLRYRVEDMYGDIAVTDAEGNTLPPRQEDDGSVIRYTVRRPAPYSFTVRAPEFVTVSVNGAELTAADASKTEDGVLSGLESYTGGQGYQMLTWSFDGLHVSPEITARAAGGAELTPLVNEAGELLYFAPQDDALAAQVSPRVREYFNRLIDYTSQAYDPDRLNALLGCILPGTELYNVYRDSRDAMIWASATQVSYDELTFGDFYPVGDDCFTCTIRYKGDFAATAWYESYTYEMQNAYELAFVKVNGEWYAAAMSAVSG